MLDYIQNQDLEADNLRVHWMSGQGLHFVPKDKTSFERTSVTYPKTKKKEKRKKGLHFVPIITFTNI